MGFYANACRVRNQRICSVKLPLRTPSSQIIIKLTAGDIPSGGAALTGFSVGAGPPAAGSLDPASISGIVISWLTTLDGPAFPAASPKQLQLGGSFNVVPTSVTFTGGDLTKSYTLRTNEADVKPPGVSDTWVWYSAFSQPGEGFLFTPGQIYTIIFNYG